MRAEMLRSIEDKLKQSARGRAYLAEEVPAILGPGTVPRGDVIGAGRIAPDSALADAANELRLINQQLQAQTKMMAKDKAARQSAPPAAGATVRQPQPGGRMDGSVGPWGNIYGSLVP